MQTPALENSLFLSPPVQTPPQITIRHNIPSIHYTISPPCSPTFSSWIPHRLPCRIPHQPPLPRRRKNHSDPILNSAGVLHCFVPWCYKYCAMQNSPPHLQQCSATFSHPSSFFFFLFAFKSDLSILCISKSFRPASVCLPHSPLSQHFTTVPTLLSLPPLPPRLALCAPLDFRS